MAKFETIVYVGSKKIAVSANSQAQLDKEVAAVIKSGGEKQLKPAARPKAVKPKAKAVKK